MSEGLRFIVSVSLFVMLFGSLIYYFNTRISTLEKAIVKQNQVLSDFIVNVKSNVLSQPSSFADLNNTGGASEEAIANAKAIYSSSNPSKKIVVPEDDNVVVSLNKDVSEDASDDDASDVTEINDESSDDDVSDDENVEVEVEHVDVEHVEVEHVDVEHVEPEHVDVEHVEVEHVDVEDVDVEDVDVEDVEPEHVEVEHVEVEHVEPEHVVVEHVEVEHVEVEHVEVEHVEVEHVVPVKPVLKVIKLEEKEQLNDSEIPNNEELQKLKVSQLKELAKQKGLKHANLKKPELIKALLAL